MTYQQQRKLETLTQQGEKIQAIKLCRDFTGWGLEEAKEYIDHLANLSHHVPYSQPTNTEHPKPFGYEEK